MSISQLNQILSWMETHDNTLKVGLERLHHIDLRFEKTNQLIENRFGIVFNLCTLLKRDMESMREDVETIQEDVADLQKRIPKNGPPQNYPH